jgi:LysR family transcriptional regulator for metE and metH
MKQTHATILAMNLEVKHLLLVQAVHEERSITRAGNRLHLTQSAISHQLKEIEDRLGAQLFERARHDMVLTPAGKRVLDSAAIVLEELRRAEEEVAEMAGRKGGSVRISTQCYTAYHWLPQLMKEFGRKHPHVSVHINVDATYRAVDALLEGTLDLALTNDKRSHDRLRFTPVFGDELIALIPATHPLASKEFLRPRDLKDESLVMPSDLKDSYMNRTFLMPAEVAPAQAFKIPLTEAIVEMVKGGMGVGVVARWMVLPYLKGSGLRAVQLGKHGLYREWWAVTLNHQKTPQYLNDFISLIANNTTSLLGERARA